MDDNAYSGIAGVSVKIYDSDGPWGDDLLATATTTAGGYFSVDWTVAKMDWLDGTVEVYAKFDSSGSYLGSASGKYTVVVA